MQSSHLRPRSQQSKGTEASCRGHAITEMLHPQSTKMHQGTHLCTLLLPGRSTMPPPRPKYTCRGEDPAGKAEGPESRHDEAGVWQRGTCHSLGLTPTGRPAFHAMCSPGGPPFDDRAKHLARTLGVPAGVSRSEWQVPPRCGPLRWTKPVSGSKGRTSSGPGGRSCAHVSRLPDFCRLYLKPARRPHLRSLIHFSLTHT